MKSEKTLDDTACMDYMFTSSVHFRVTSHPECTHTLWEAQRHNTKIN